MDPADGCLGWAGPHRLPSLGWPRPRPVALRAGLAPGGLHPWGALVSWPWPLALLAGLADGEIQPKVALVGWP